MFSPKMSVCAATAVKSAFFIPIIPIPMLPSIASLKIAAMVAALGLDTAEWSKPSADMTNQVQALADATAAAAKGEQPKVPLQETINKIKDLADKSNDKDAQFAMGLFLQQSNQQGALDQAVTYYKKAADNGQLQAMNNYGFIIAASTQDVAKVKEGISSIKAASDKGLNAARRNMAAIFLRGMAGEKQDPAAAQKLLETAAAEKDYQAAFELAQFYLGAGGEATKNDDTAWTWLNKAADGGNPNALAALGSVLFDGKKFGNKEIKADPAAAVKKFEELAAQNVPAGLRTMGELHEGGLAGVAKDFKKAFEYYGKAAQGNDAVAQVRLAGFYDRGVDLDPKDTTIDVAPNAAAALERVCQQAGSLPIILPITPERPLAAALELIRSTRVAVELLGNLLAREIRSDLKTTNQVLSIPNLSRRLIAAINYLGEIPGADCKVFVKLSQLSLENSASQRAQTTTAPGQSILDDPQFRVTGRDLALALRDQAEGHVRGLLVGGRKWERGVLVEKISLRQGKAVESYWRPSALLMELWNRGFLTATEFLGKPHRQNVTSAKVPS